MDCFTEKHINYMYTVALLGPIPFSHLYYIYKLLLRAGCMFLATHSCWVLGHILSFNLTIYLPPFYALISLSPPLIFSLQFSIYLLCRLKRVSLRVTSSLRVIHSRYNSFTASILDGNLHPIVGHPTALFLALN